MLADESEVTDKGESDGDMQGKKRPFPGPQGKATKRLKAQAQPKNALMHLYELKPGLCTFIVIFMQLRIIFGNTCLFEV